MGSASDIRDLLAPALAADGLELWDVEVTHDVIRVLVDRTGGIDLEALASVASRVVSPALDEHPELTPDRQFQLEVSSPGLERTLRSVDQFSRYVGSEITVKTTTAVSGSRRHQGTLIGVDDASITLAAKDAQEGAVTEIGHDQIDRARTVLVWGPDAAPGGRKPTQRSKAARPVAGQAAGGSTAAREPKDTAS